MVPGVDCGGPTLNEWKLRDEGKSMATKVRDPNGRRSFGQQSRRGDYCAGVEGDDSGKANKTQDIFVQVNLWQKVGCMILTRKYGQNVTDC